MKVMKRKIVQMRKQRKYLQFFVFLPKDFAQDIREVTLIQIGDLIILAKDDEKAMNVIKGLVSANVI